MTANRFAELCEAVAIAPCVALEDDEIRQTLRDGDDEQVAQLLQENF